MAHSDSPGSRVKGNSAKGSNKAGVVVSVKVKANSKDAANNKAGGKVKGSGNSRAVDKAGDSSAKAGMDRAMAVNSLHAG